MDKVKGLITEADYLEMSKEFRRDKERMEHLMIENEKRLSDIDVRLAAGDNRRELVERYMNLEHLTREMVDTLIDYISVGKRIPHTRDVPIEIHWRF